MAGIPTIEPYPMPRAGELPVNTAPWEPDPDRAVLLVHDMQRYFLRKFPVDEAPGADLVRNAARLRDAAVAVGVPVAYTAQPGGMTDEQRGLLKDFWGPGMRVDPVDREVVAPLAPAPDDWMLPKWRYSAFFRTDLLQRMRAEGRDQLVVCGVYAHIGVLTTALESFTHDIETFLVADAVADFTAAYHRMALSHAAERCAVVTTTEAVVTGLAR
ncbi:isochorismatase family protein [Streptomyces sp. NPDC017979]|uniref:isochorismatase family protein n=1 Tax=unclassified Streptomyces TaxID=2593676 RepID=UPI00378C4DFC